MELNINYDNFKTRNKEISNSGGGGEIKCSVIDNIEVILKRFPMNLKWKYIKEKCMYLKLKTYYTPTLMYYDDNNLILIIEDVGDSLKKLIRNDEYQLIPTNIIDMIENIVHNLYHEYGVIHGDITTRNICIKDKNVYLIDYEWTTQINILPNNKYEFINAKKEEMHPWFDDQARLLTHPDFLRKYFSAELYNKEI